MSILDNDIEHLHPLLKQVYTEAKFRWIRDHPATAQNPTPPRPRLNETSRARAVQTAYYAQGRSADLAYVNGLRKTAGLPSISADENKYTVTAAHYGQSAHNFMPARAFDVAFVTSKGEYVQGPTLYNQFAAYVAQDAKALGIAIVWGGRWGDKPHTELRDWRKM